MNREFQMRQLALVSALRIPTLVGAQANDALPREFGCIAQDEISNDMHPSELARICALVPLNNVMTTLCRSTTSTPLTGYTINNACAMKVHMWY